MYTQVKFSTIKGKTIQSAAESCEGLVLVFTDETFVTMIFKDDGDISIHLQDVEEDDVQLYWSLLVLHGAMTVEEYNQKMHNLDLQKLEQKERREREQYEYLKKKYS